MRLLLISFLRVQIFMSVLIDSFAAPGTTRLNLVSLTHPSHHTQERDSICLQLDIKFLAES